MLEEIQINNMSHLSTQDLFCHEHDGHGYLAPSTEDLLQSVERNWL